MAPGAPLSVPNYRKLGEILVEAGVLEPEQLGLALSHQRQWGGRLGRVLLDYHFIDDATLAHVLASQLHIELVQLSTLEIDLEVIRLVPQALAERHGIFPVRLSSDGRTSGELTVAFSDPTNLAAIDELRLRLGRSLRVAVASETEIAWAVRRFYQGEDDGVLAVVPGTPPDPALFGAQSTLGNPDEEGLAELEPLPSDSQIPENGALSLRAITVSQPGLPPVDFQIDGDYAADLGPPPPVATGASPLSVDPSFAASFGLGQSPPTEADPAGQSPAPPILPPIFSEEDLRRVLAGLGSQSGVSTPSSELLDAVVRILVRKGLVTQAEILAEVAASQSKAS